MTIQVNIAEAKSKLSELVARAEAGEEVVLARHGKAVATIVAKESKPATGKRPLGVWKQYGPLSDPDLFLRPDPEVEAWVERPIAPEE